MTSAALSHKGKSRKTNEDAYMAEEPIFCVADGMGGHFGGEIASKTAIDTLKSYKKEIISGKNPHKVLLNAFAKASEQIIEQAEKNPHQHGMGTTLSAIYLSKKTLYCCHIGDSRIYLIRNNNIKQISKDHSFVAELLETGQITPEEARNHPNRNIITRALGVEGESNPDLFTLGLKKSDRILICSDGLHTMLNDKEILDTIKNYPSLEDSCSKLISEANNRGGLDNITAVLIDPFENKAKVKTKVKDVVKILGIIFGLFLFISLIITWFGFNSYFIKLRSNQIVLYQGFNRKFIGIHFYAPVKEKTVAPENIPQFIKDRLSDGVSVESKSAGLKSLTYYKSF